MEGSKGYPYPDRLADRLIQGILVGRFQRKDKKREREGASRSLGYCRYETLGRLRRPAVADLELPVLREDIEDYVQRTILVDERCANLDPAGLSVLAFRD